MNCSRSLISFALMGMLSLAACDRKPTRVELPPYDAAAIAGGAISQYDTDGDGAISGKELDKVPALKDNPQLPQKAIDHNNDGKVTNEEIQRRVQIWIDSKVGMMAYNATVHMDGQPLEGAEVKLVPEKFMGGVVPEATATSDAGGTVVLMASGSEVPPDLQGLGVRQGFYKVEVTHPGKAIPPRYNTESTLGLEVAQDTYGSSAAIVFDVQSR